MVYIDETAQRGRDDDAHAEARDERVHSYCDWDGVAGLRWVEVCERAGEHEAQDQPDAHRTERELGTISEPMS